MSQEEVFLRLRKKRREAKSLEGMVHSVTQSPSLSRKSIFIQEPRLYSMNSSVQSMYCTSSRCLTCAPVVSDAGDGSSVFSCLSVSLFSLSSLFSFPLVFPLPSPPQESSQASDSKPELFPPPPSSESESLSS